MAHHGPNPFPENEKSEFDDTADRNKLMRTLLDTTGFKGALGDFPQGKLNEDDEGGIQFRVGNESGKVILDFGTQVTWVGMDPQQAADLASSLMKWARYAAREKGETVAFNLNAL
jgi:hypothetical protein